MKVLGVIPARFNSTRFPGKVLAYLGKKSVIQWVYENAKRASLLDKVIIATDDKRIFKEAESFKAEVMMTSKRHKSGTERTAEAAKKNNAQVIVNIQADEPFLTSAMINRLVKEFYEDNKLEMATLVTSVKDGRDLDNKNVVKVVLDKDNYALYFSRSRIPYQRNQPALAKRSGVRKSCLSGRQIATANRWYKHIGIYAYKSKFLFDFVKLPVSGLEKIESLEQLRALENGHKIKAVIVKKDTAGIDTPEDLEKAKRKLRSHLN